jgi:type I restriction enzyme S subunit
MSNMVENTLPEGWKENEWSDVMEIKNGKSQKEYLVNSGGYPIYGSGGVMKGRVSESLCPKFTTIIGRKGTIDSPKYIEEEFWNVDTAFGLCANEKMISKILYYFCLTFNFRSLNKSTTLPSLTKRDLLKIKIPLPPLEEQKRIVAKIDGLFAKIDKAISLTEESLTHAKNLLPSLLKEVFEKGKADGWEEKKLGEVCDVRDGTHDSPKYIDEGYALVTSKNLKKGKLDFGKIKYISVDDYIKINKRSKVDINDILFAMIGTIGNPVLVENPPNYAIKNVALFKQKTNEVTMPFLKYVLVTPQVIETMTSQAKGATQKFVGLTYLRAFMISFPTIEKQNTLVNYLEKVKLHSRQTQSKLEEQLAYLKQLKSSILSKAFKGEL